MTLSLIYVRDFLFCLENYSWLGSSWSQDLLGTKISWLPNISPELWVLSSPCTTWNPWIHIVSYADLVPDDNWYSGLTFSCFGIRPKALTFSEIWKFFQIKLSEIIVLWRERLVSTLVCQFSFCFHRSLLNSSFQRCLMNTWVS